MNDFQVLISIIFAIIITVTLLIMPLFLYYKNKVNKLEKIINKLGDLKRISKTLNIFGLYYLFRQF